VTISNRFQLLHTRAFDLLLNDIAHTIEREFKEITTGTGFTFSSPYRYDSAYFFGNQTLVECAEERKRHSQCSSLFMCALNATTIPGILETLFPSGFFKVISEEEIGNEVGKYLTDSSKPGVCNVFPGNGGLGSSISAGINDARFVGGSKQIAKEPNAVVTRNDDREFSDIINWVLQARLYGSEQGLMTKISKLCQKYTNFTSHVSELNFMNAVHCVSLRDYGLDGLGMNRINNGTTGMLYHTPFGKLENIEDTDAGVTPGSLLDNITKNGSLNCGVVISDGFDMLAAMGFDYCRALAAALFSGDHTLVKFTNFTSTLDNADSSFAALNSGTIDVLAGGKVERKYDFGTPSSGKGVQFSTPYFYGDETAGEDVSFFSLVTREDDKLFSSFVNCVVLATIYAQVEDIVKKKNSEEMPLLPMFGPDLKWALRDAIFYSGSYDELYTKHFGDVLAEKRGRNILNENGGPLFHSWPGVSL